MTMLYKIPLLLTPQPEGGFTVTSPLLPELVTEGESIDEVLVNVRDAFEAIRELYEDLGKKLPHNMLIAVFILLRTGENYSECLL